MSAEQAECLEKHVEADMADGELLGRISGETGLTEDTIRRWVEIKTHKNPRRKSEGVPRVAAVVVAATEKAAVETRGREGSRLAAEVVDILEKAYSESPYFFYDKTKKDEVVVATGLPQKTIYNWLSAKKRRLVQSGKIESVSYEQKKVLKGHLAAGADLNDGAVMERIVTETGLTADTITYYFNERQGIREKQQQQQQQQSSLTEEQQQQQQSSLTEELPSEALAC